MLRIAIVEDDPHYREQLENYILRYAEETGEKLLVTHFSDGDEIALHYKAKYDVILMDIEMTFMDGMTAAEEIRKVDSEVVIIFITNSPQYAIKGYAVDALDYVLKPISYFAFSQRLGRAMERMKNRSRRTILVAVRGSSVRVDVGQLYYVESMGHDLFYHMADGVLQAPGSLKELEEELADTMFYRCNKSYLVNLEFVDKVRENSALVHGETVPLSRTKKKAFLDALNNYVNEVAK